LDEGRAPYGGHGGPVIDADPQAAKRRFWAMSLLGSFGWDRRRAAEKAAQSRIAALQTALDQCNARARRSAEARLKVMGAVAVVFLALGFATGVHREPILQTTRSVAANLGIYADDANAAYQKGDSASALTRAMPARSSCSRCATTGAAARPGTTRKR
jgi:hypothetical protein